MDDRGAGAIFTVLCNIVLYCPQASDRCGPIGGAAIQLICLLFANRAAHDRNLEHAAWTCMIPVVHFETFEDVIFMFWQSSDIIRYHPLSSNVIESLLCKFKILLMCEALIKLMPLFAFPCLSHPRHSTPIFTEEQGGELDGVLWSRPLQVFPPDDQQHVQAAIA